MLTPSTFIRYTTKTKKYVSLGQNKNVASIWDVRQMLFLTSYSRRTYCVRKYLIYFVEAEPIKEKRCSKCGKVKPIEQFGRRRNRNGTWIPVAICKECKNKIQKELKERKCK